MTRNEWRGRRGRSSKWITPHKRLAIYLRDRFLCAYCGADLTTARPRDVHLDHLQARNRGGSNDAANLVTACSRCNAARHDGAWRTFLRRLMAEQFDTPAAAKGAADDRIRRILRQTRRTLNTELARDIILGERPMSDGLR